MGLEGELRDKAAELRIDLIGFSRIEKTSYEETVLGRIKRGLIPKEMIENTECFQLPDVYSDPERSLAGARTLIYVGAPYLEVRSPPKNMNRRGAIARHVWRETYRDLNSKRDLLVDFLRSMGTRRRERRPTPVRRPERRDWPGSAGMPSR
jgi:epoxyqueuosine reductase QueG